MSTNVNVAIHNIDSQNDDFDGKITMLMAKLSTLVVGKRSLLDLNDSPPMDVPQAKSKANRDSQKKWGDSMKL